MFKFKRDGSEQLPEPAKPNLWQVLVSVLGAIFGVQSSVVRERDFTRGQAWWIYALVGIVLVLAIVLLLIGLAKLILRLAAA
jgi:hypothetical protein